MNDRILEITDLLLGAAYADNVFHEKEEAAVVSDPALVAEASGIPLIAVQENRTILEVTNTEMGMPNVVEVSSYLEAAGVVLALRRGLSLESLRRPLGAARTAAVAELVLQSAGEIRAAASVVPSEFA